MKNKVIIAIVSGIIVFFLGFFIGKNNIKEVKKEIQTVTKWEKGQTVHDSILMPQPYEVISYKYKEGKTIHDSVLVSQKIDTAAILADYNLLRKYNLDFSNDSLGTFKVNAEVSQNKLMKATSLITPNIKTVYQKETIYKVKKLQWYTILGTSLDMRTNKMQIGVDLNQHYLFGISGIRLGDNYGYTIDAGIKF